MAGRVLDVKPVMAAIPPRSNPSLLTAVFWAEGTRQALSTG
jgi:hypothetical protein